MGSDGSGSGASGWGSVANDWGSGANDWGSGASESGSGAWGARRVAPVATSNAGPSVARRRAGPTLGVPTARRKSVRVGPTVGLPGAAQEER